MCLPDNHIVDIPIDPTVNLPVISSPQPTLKEQDNFGPHLFSSFVANMLDLPGLAKQRSVVKPFLMLPITISLVLRGSLLGGTQNFAST
jgi:hypothetical protein